MISRRSRYPRAIALAAAICLALALIFAAVAARMYAGKRDLVLQAQSFSGQMEAAREQIAQALHEQEAAQSAAKLQTSLANAHKQRADELSAENEKLGAQISRLEKGRMADKSQIDELSALLTAAEENLAGTKSLYTEAAEALRHAKSRMQQDGAQIALLEELLTKTEEDYAGASALIGEHDAQIERAQIKVSSYYNSMQAMRIAAEAKQAEIDRLREQLALRIVPDSTPEP